MLLSVRSLIVPIALVLALVSATSAHTEQTLAVVPFANITLNAEDDWIGVGIVEALNTGLHESQDVVSRSVVESTLTNVTGTSVSTQTQEALLAVAGELGVELLLAGSYQRLGDQLRITARLIDVQNKTTAQTFKIDGRYHDLFTLQDRLTEAVQTSIVTTLVSTATLQNVNRKPVNDGTTKERPPVAPTSSVNNTAVNGNLLLNKTNRTVESATDTWTATDFAVGTRPTIRAVRTDQPPTIDGQLDDATWRTAALITEFVQTNPVEGAPPTENTEVRIAYDADYLYFAFYAHYKDPSQMRANRVDRDQARSDDWIAVIFDTFLDQQRGYRFFVNAYGVQNDAILTGGRRSRGPPGAGGDRSWDALFESRGMIVDDGWTAELAIPLKSIRYPARDDDEHRWGFQITRTMQTKDETVVWSPVSRNIAGVLTQMGIISGLNGLSVSRNLEILPTATAIQLGELTDTEFKEGDVRPDIGLNIKYGVTSDLTVDFTLNPDFSQIESDRPQIEINQRYPLFFRELRPFFLEGQEIFRTPGRINLVHTRTIIDPTFGAKLTGKTGKTTLGVLVTNDEAQGRLDDASTPGFGKTGQVFIGRARRDLHSESYIGAIVTDREFFGSYSRVGGIDGRFRLGQSHSAQFIAVASSNRDLDGKEKTGPMFDMGFRRDSRHLNYRLQYNVIDPNFDTRTGFVRRVDTRRLDTDIEYVWWPEHWLISWGPGFSYLRNVDHVGAVQDEDFRADVNMRFSRNIFFRADGRRELERYRNVNFYKTRFSLRNSINTDRRFSLFYGFDWGDQIRFIENPFLGRFFEYNFGTTLRPTSRLNTRITLDTSRFHNIATNELEFNVKIVRAFTTYQFTDRFLVRNIVEHNSGTGEIGINLLFTYRVNSGTVFYIGYDDRLKEWVNMNEERFATSFLQRQRRAFFTKFQYLFRY